MHMQDLPCFDGRKSFYGKAKLIIKDDETLLQSYNTIVCRIDDYGTFRKLWDGYSATTMRHIKSFCELFGITFGGKSWWESLPVSA